MEQPVSSYLVFSLYPACITKKINQLWGVFVEARKEAIDEKFFSDFSAALLDYEYSHPKTILANEGGQKDILEQIKLIVANYIAHDNKSHTVFIEHLHAIINALNSEEPSGFLQRTPLSNNLRPVLNSAALIWQKLYAQIPEHNKINNPFNQLPAEISAQIFSFLEVKENATAAQVCKAFNLFANNDYVWMQRLQNDFAISANELDVLYAKHASYKSSYAVCKNQARSFLLFKIFAGGPPVDAANQAVGELKAIPSRYTGCFKGDYDTACEPIYKLETARDVRIGTGCLFEFNISATKANELLNNKKIKELMSHCIYVHYDVGVSGFLAAKWPVKFQDGQLVENGDVIDFEEHPALQR